MSKSKVFIERNNEPLRVSARVKSATLLGQQIRDSRIQKNLTQKEAADLMGCSRWSLVHWELGKFEPGWGARREIERVLGVPT